MVRWMKACLRGILLLGLVLLTGCLQYDLDLQFDSQTHGQFEQHLHWRGSAIAPQDKLDPWLQILTERTEAVGGRLRFLADDELAITVPFNNGRDLEARFNQFFNLSAEKLPFTLPSGEPIQAELSLQQGNWILAIANHISLRIDLTMVPDLAATGLPVLKTAQLLEGRITITTPWGVLSPIPEMLPEETWLLTAGEVNQFEADFWVPSPIGIGALAIALLIAIGYGFKYGRPRK
ncbi:MAG: DUF3153 domain-containing protein [Cyanobacteria bacterium P01_F01_bin.86]